MLLIFISKGSSSPLQLENWNNHTVFISYRIFKGFIKIEQLCLAPSLTEGSVTGTVDHSRINGKQYTLMDRTLGIDCVVVFNTVKCHDGHNESDSEHF